MKKRACFRVVEKGQVYYTYYDTETKLLDAIPNADYFSGESLNMPDYSTVYKCDEEFVGSYSDMEHIMYMNTSLMVIIASIPEEYIVVDISGYTNYVTFGTSDYIFGHYAPAPQADRPFNSFRSIGFCNISRVSVTPIFKHFGVLGRDFNTGLIYIGEQLYAPKTELIKVTEVPFGIFRDHSILGLIEDEESKIVLYSDNGKIKERRI